MIKIILSIIFVCIVCYFAYCSKNKYLSKICLCICLGAITCSIVNQIIKIFNSEYYKIILEYSKNIFPYIFDILFNFIWLAMLCSLFYYIIKRIAQSDKNI